MNSRFASNKSKKGERGSIFLACRLGFPAGSRKSSDAISIVDATVVRMGISVVSRAEEIWDRIWGHGEGSTSSQRAPRRTRADATAIRSRLREIRRRDLAALLPRRRRRRRRRCRRSVGSRRACVAAVLRTHARTGKHSHVLREAYVPTATGRSAAMHVNDTADRVNAMHGGTKTAVRTDGKARAVISRFNGWARPVTTYASRRARDITHESTTRRS